MPPRLARVPRPDQLLEIALVAVLVLISGRTTLEIARTHPVGVDVEIPLRAAERWLNGGAPYLASAFDVPAGRELPFLYAPYTLPVFAPFTLIPTGLVIALALVGGIALAAWAVRRLGVGWRVVPLVLLWPPFVEGIVGTNIEVLGFAALVALTAPASAPLAGRPAWLASALTATTFVFKAAQIHVLASVARARPRVAAGAVAAVAVIAALTLPLVGVDAWSSWLASGVRASDPAWAPIGAPLSTVVGREIAIVATLVSIALAFLVRGPRTTALLGLLIIVGAPTLHLFGFIYLLPALLVLRRDVALALGALTATAVASALWVAVVATIVLLVAAERWPVLLRAPAVPGRG